MGKEDKFLRPRTGGNLTCCSREAELRQSCGGSRVRSNAGATKLRISIHAPQCHFRECVRAQKTCKKKRKIKKKNFSQAFLDGIRRETEEHRRLICILSKKGGGWWVLDGKFQMCDKKSC